MCEEQLGLIHDFWYVKDLSSDCFFKLFDRHVVEILSFLLYTHVNEVTNFRSYLMSKVLFPGFLIMTVLEFVRGFDYCRIV